MDLFDRKKKQGLEIAPARVLALGVAAAALWLLADRRRRSRTRDQMIKLFKRGTKRLDRRRAYALATLKGKVDAIKHGEDTVPPSDPALAAKVSSEVLGDYPGININVENGVVVLRGELGDEDRISELEQAVRKVTGVVDVKNFVHLPGQKPPNLP